MISRTIQGEQVKILKREQVFLSAFVGVGCLDWLTTLVGRSYGATEGNLFLSSLTGSSMALFSLVKLSVVMVTGLAFYKAAAMSGPKNKDCRVSRVFLDGSYFIVLLALSDIVANNIITILEL